MPLRKQSDLSAAPLNTEADPNTTPDCPEGAAADSVRPRDPSSDPGSSKDPKKPKTMSGPYAIPTLSFREGLVTAHPVKMRTLGELSAASSAPKPSEESKALTQYSVFDPSHVFHDPHTLHKLSGLDKRKKPEHYVAYRPHRIALHETIVIVTTTLQYKNEAELKAHIVHIMALIKPDMENKTNMLLKLRETLLNCALLHIKAYPYSPHERAGFDSLVSSTVKQYYVPFLLSESLQSDFKDEDEYLFFLAQHIADMLYTQLTVARCRAYIKSAIDTLLSRSEVSALPTPSSKERITFTVSGGTGSGKTSSVAVMKKIAAERYHILWQHIAKLDTNIYQSLLIDKETVSTTYFSQLSAPEASHIHRLVYNAFLILVKIGRAPHMFIDQVFVNDDKLDLSIFYAGRVEGMVVSTDVRQAIQRAYQRGIDTGRFEPTRTILRTHRAVAEEFPAVLSHFQSASIIYRIMDNNAPKGIEPSVVAIIHMKTKEIRIKSVEKLLAFIQKRHINVDAKSDEAVYEDDPILADKISEFTLQKAINMYFSPLFSFKIIIEAPISHKPPEPVRQHQRHP